jgi:hypothetical protein
VFFGKGASALFTAKTLEAVAVFSEAFTDGIAVVAGHCSLAPFQASDYNAACIGLSRSLAFKLIGLAGCYKQPAGLSI